MGLSIGGEFNEVNEESSRQGNVTVGLTAVELRIGGTDYDGRQTLVIYNDSNKIIYIGDASVTTSDGQPLQPKARAYFNYSEDNRVYAISDTASLTVRLMESR